MRRTRPSYSPEFRRQMVELVRAGRDPVDLAREFEPTAQSICRWVALADRQDGRREEKGSGLAAAERDELDRAASTISRELRRNAATRSGGLEYRATTAQWHAERSARRPKRTKLVLNPALRIYVEERLAGLVVASSGASVRGPAVSWKGRRHGPRQDRRWARARSPEQIARRLPVDFPHDETMRISHEAIHQSLLSKPEGRCAAS